MIRLIKIVRTVGFIMFIIVASAAGGLFGAFLPYREKFQNNEIKIEMIDRKRDAEEEDGDETDVPD
jgi:hypothetical protein